VIMPSSLPPRPAESFKLAVGPTRDCADVGPTVFSDSGTSAGASPGVTETAARPRPRRPEFNSHADDPDHHGHDVIIRLWPPGSDIRVMCPSR
jgi:hypothetical protein